jgi:beta-galactosidase
MTPSAARQTLTLKTGWKFSRGDDPRWAQCAFDDAAWESVRVPHDWAITGPFDRENDIQYTAILEDGERRQRPHTGRTGGLPHAGKAWYRLRFNLPADVRSRRVRIEFDGVMSHSRVFCNGRPAGSWPFGYASFAFDLTALVQPGENLLAVSVDNKPLASRWYPGAGIFRHVRLVTLSPVHVAHWGTRVTTPAVSADSAAVRIDTTVDNTLAPLDVELETCIAGPDGAVAAEIRTTERVSGSMTFSHTLAVPLPRLWSPDSSALYTARTRVLIAGRAVDELDTVFGIRTLRFDAATGFHLNGAPVRLNGVCQHHDLGPLGAAVNKAAMARQLRILQDMGCNAIRTSHNPPAPELLDLADRMGFLVIDEAFDEWRSAKMENGYHTLFEEWAEKDLRAMIRRDRNHPSVIMWSLGNEIREQAEPVTGLATCRFLHDIAHDEDPTRPTTAGFNQSDAAIANGLAAAVDVPGWNYRPHRYSHYHLAHPDWPVYGSETASCVSSRGEYYFPVDEERGTRRPTLQCNSFDLTCAGWASSPDAEFRGVDDNPFIMGEFVWTGFDYLGEPTPYGEEWPSRSSYFGIIDLCGIPKDRFYLYQSRWAQKKTLHLLPHWTWPERVGQVTPVHCYSSWDAVELFVNGVSQGWRHKNERNLLNRYRLTWNGVLYAPGELRAVAYDAAGKPAAETVVRTAGEPARLQLAAEGEGLTADGDDMAFVNVRVTDVAGVLCPRARNRVRFAVEGPAEIAAVDNGDATSVEPFASPDRPVFNGQCMVYLRARAGKRGTVRLRAEADGLKAAELTLKASPSV